MVRDEIRRALQEVLAENDRLRIDNERLHAHNARLNRRLDEVEQLLEAGRRAGKRQAAPFSKRAPKESPKKPGRHEGADYGRARHRQPPDHVDQTVAVELPEYCEYGSCIEKESTAKQFQEEMPVPEPLVIRFEISIGRCRRCGRRVQGHHSLQTSDALGAAGSQLGPRAQAMAGVLMNIRNDLTAAAAGDRQAVI